MGNLIEALVDCVDCYDEGVLFFGNGHEEYTQNFVSALRACHLKMNTANGMLKA